MPNRKTPEGTFDDMVAGAFARNGLNTLLLDIKEDVSAVGVTVRHIQDEQEDAKISRRNMHEKLDFFGRQLQGPKQTVDDIGPKVLVLDTERTQKIGARIMVGRVVTRGRLIVGAVASGGATGLWHYWDVVRTWFPGGHPSLPPHP